MFPISRLAFRYCLGKGIEIGGAIHNQFRLHDCLNVDREKYGFFQKWQEENHGKYLPVDIVALGDELPFKDNVFDYVITSHVIEHFENPIRALIEWRRVIKPGGVIFTICPHRNRIPQNFVSKVVTAEFLYRVYLNNVRSMENKHHYWWTLQDFLNMVNIINRELKLDMKVVDVQDPDDKVGNGFTVVLKK